MRQSDLRKGQPRRINNSLTGKLHSIVISVLSTEQHWRNTEHTEQGPMILLTAVSPIYLVSCDHRAQVRIQAQLLSYRLQLPHRSDRINSSFVGGFPQSPTWISHTVLCTVIRKIFRRVGAVIAVGTIFDCFAHVMQIVISGFRPNIPVHILGNGKLKFQVSYTCAVQSLMGRSPERTWVIWTLFNIVQYIHSVGSATPWSPELPKEVADLGFRVPGRPNQETKSSMSMRACHLGPWCWAYGHSKVGSARQPSGA